MYTASQVRGLDYAAIHQFGIAGYELMCRAGRAVVDHALANYPKAESWLIICGPGNNGGDGYVVARLAVAAGINVTVCCLTDTERHEGDAATALNDWRESGGEVLPWPLPPGLHCDLVFDAILGTGISRKPQGLFLQAIIYLNELDCCTVAIDIPSGLNADSGEIMGSATHADSTVSFVGQKRGMYTADGPDCCGSIVFDDLEIPAEVSKAVENPGEPPGSLLHKRKLQEMLKPRRKNSHKGSYGHVLAIGGQQGMSGAISLCGTAALRSGAGKVSIATDPVHASLINLIQPELMVHGVADEQALLDLVTAGQVLAIGPGLGRSSWSSSLLQACLELEARLVIDADALNLMAEMKFPAENHQQRNWILTPHPAEAARLLACSSAEIQADRVAAAQAIAEKYAACTVLKGSGSIIAMPDGSYAICPYGNPGMATAGSGDVLTGVIAALWAQGMSMYHAALSGVLAHALAGDMAENESGQMALLASDITGKLHKVWMSALTTTTRGNTP